MAVQTITYGDKSYLNENADIPATNKVQDTDMNEIKTVVNNNANILEGETTYSTNEANTGKVWIDSKPIYRIVLQLTSFSVGLTNVNHNISNFGELTDIKAIAYRNGGDYEIIPTVVVPTYQSQYQISIYDINDTRFKLFLGSETLTGSSKIEKINVIFEYTKTTD